jgi:hypothetical protein
MLAVLARHVDYIAKRPIGPFDLCIATLELELRQDPPLTPQLNASHLRSA